MQFLILIYPNPQALEALPQHDFAATMRSCLSHADELKARGALLDSQMLEPPATAKTLRKRAGKLTITDGPFTETKEMLAGFNLVEAADMAAALELAAQFPWAEYGSIEVRPILPLAAMRARVEA